MNDSRSIDEIFCAAIEIDSASDRKSWLNQVCGDDAELRRQVDRLLHAHFRGGSIVDSPAHAMDATIHQLRPERPGTQIGPYKLLQQIGEGGMGTVYMAEQTRPVQRKVALKLIKAGMDSHQIIARFEAERQALALMDHVNIARVLDAGATDQGRPYFVMELVHGVPITKYCDDNRLTLRQRLELFVPVCHAIQHAHQKGIIHRDIKPSNVMVTLYDGNPVPKVIDFGVAKATEQKLTERTLFTQYGTMVGTLEYMSPEQAEMSALGVDTRSDIYSLGVLLYELLTGSTPLSRTQMKEAAFAELLRLIKEEEPPKPSTRLSESGESLASISAQRHTEPAKLSKLMRGELDWIVMKTLEKDRNRRYETANGFAADVQRYLNDEPVQACPPSVAYRFRKLVRRNRAGVLTVSVLGLALLAATSSIGWTIRDRSAQQAEMERERATARQQLEQDRAVRQAKLDANISQALDETKVGYERDNLTDALAAVKRAEALLTSDSGTSRELRQRVHQWRAELTILNRLEELAFSLSREDSRKTDAAYCKVFHDIGVNIDEMSVEEAAKQIRSHITWLRLTESLDRWTGIRHEMMFLDDDVDARSEAGRRKLRLLQVARAADADELRSQARLAVERWDVEAVENMASTSAVHQLPASTLRQLAMVLFWGRENGRDRQEGGQDAAIELLENAWKRRPDDYQLAMACASYYMQLVPQQWAKARHYWSIGLALRPGNASIQASLATTYSHEGNVSQAIFAYRRAIELDPQYLAAYNNLGFCLSKQGKLDEAIACYRTAIEIDPKAAMPHSNLGAILKEQGKLDEAVACCRNAIRLDPKFANAHANLGVTLRDQRRWDDAMESFRQALDLDPDNLKALAGRGSVYRTLQAPEKALADFGRSLAIQADDAWVLHERGLVQIALNRSTAAIADFTRAAELEPKNARRWYNRGTVYYQLKQFENAVADFTMAIELDPNDVPAYTVRGVAHGLLGNLDMAIDDYTSAIALRPDLAASWRGRGISYSKLGKWSQAESDFARAVALEPEHSVSQGRLAICRFHLGRHQEAIDSLSGLTTPDPNLAPFHNQIAWLLTTSPDTSSHDPAQAVKLAKRAIELVPEQEQGTFWNTLGVAHYRAGECQLSIQALTKSMELRSGGDSFDWFVLAMAHWKLGEQDAARKRFDQALAWMEMNAKDNDALIRLRDEAIEFMKP